METKEYASKSVGTAGLTLGIIGTALAGLVSGNGSGGILSGLFGGGNCQAQISAYQAEIGKLQSEKYTDVAISAQRDRLEALNEKVIGYIIDIEKRVSIAEATQPLYQQITNQQIASVANSLAGLAAVVGNITKTIVPSSAICPQPMPLLNAWVAPTTATAA